MTLPALLSPTISPGPKEVMVNNEQHGDDLSITDCKDKKQKKENEIKHKK